MIPIGDYAGQRRSFPFVTYALIAINVLVFLYQVSLPEAQLVRFFSQWGLVPREITQGVDAPPTIELPIYATFLSSIFMHGGWLHLGGNMLFLWVFGDNVEDAFGHLKYLLFYLLCGVGASLAQIAINTGSTIPNVGASGAIAGVMGAYLVMFPGATVRTLVTIVFFITVTYLPAVLVIGLWFVLQLISGIGSLGVRTQQTGGVAFWAHIGGLVVGAVLAFFFRRRDYRASAPTTYGGYGY
ncbi:MAG: Rhomboid family protein [uncultured Thermomicrobiales bacterium]|uniref:Rhomboid family protein n=1 Tax=uncultured Thermomicrobiales bacterium TaxID=1645740 RepID=A0A6J4UUZ0_9BACT|nr:MAG: Rhomboid family protein [uncultured Thermomicrobiales bacterium]